MKYLNRPPTNPEWSRFRKYASRMRELRVDTSEDPVTPDILFPLQICAVNEPFFPNLKTFKCECATEVFVPFIPLFLSRKTTQIEIKSIEGSPGPQ